MHFTACSETSNTMYHLAEVRWQQGRREAAAKLVEQSLEIMETQVGGAGQNWSKLVNACQRWSMRSVVGAGGCQNNR